MRFAMSERTVQSLHAKQTEIGTESERRNGGKKNKNPTLPGNYAYTQFYLVMSE